MFSSTISLTITNEPEAVGDTPSRWSADHVGRRLVEAFSVLDRLPRVRGPRAAGNHWPIHRVEWADQLAQAELPEAERRERARSRVATLLRPPSGCEITRMDEALEWLRFLRSEDAQLAEVVSFWALHAARRRSVRAICRLRGWKPPTFYYQRARGLTWLADRLEKSGVPVT